ncbi:MAG TPA: hypothetical protein VFQ65_20575, partial [Kofleriaceae bacterium]|nr:hypothetical protein [Kofleriaceae bacterium]
DVPPTAYHRCEYSGINAIYPVDVMAYSHAEEALCEASLAPTGTLWAWQGPQNACPAPWSSNQYPPNP